MGDIMMTGKQTIMLCNQLSLAIPPWNEYRQRLRPVPGKKWRVLHNTRPCELYSCTSL